MGDNRNALIDSLLIICPKFSSVERGVGKAYEDIGTVVINILQAENSTAPAAEEG